MVYFMNLKKNWKKKFRTFFFEKKFLNFFFNFFFKILFFQFFFQNLCVKYFFIIFVKNFKSLASKMAELFLNNKKKFGQNFFKTPALFLWLDTGNPKIVTESSISLVSKTNFKSCFGRVFKSQLSGFQKMEMKTWPVWQENLMKTMFEVGFKY